MSDLWVGNNLYNGKYRPHTQFALFALNFACAEVRMAVSRQFIT